MGRPLKSALHQKWQRSLDEYTVEKQQQSLRSQTIKGHKNATMRRHTWCQSLAAVAMPYAVTELEISRLRGPLDNLFDAIPRFFTAPNCYFQNASDDPLMFYEAFRNLSRFATYLSRTIVPLPPFRADDEHQGC